MDNNKKVAFSVTLAIMSFIFVSACGSAMNSVMQKIIEAFPDTPTATVRMISTLPSILGMIFGLVFGAIVGKKLKWKTLMLLGLALITIGGVMPMWVNSNFTLILVARAIVGIGTGTCQCRNAIILKVYSKEDAPKQLGNGVLIMNLGSTLFTFLTGILGQSSWKNAFLVYGIAAISFVLVLIFMKEPEMDEPVTVDAGEKVKESMGIKPFIYAFLAFFATIILYPLLSGMATYLSVKGIGSSAVAGTILSLYTIGGACSGIVFGKLNAKLKRWMLPLAWAVMAIGQAIVLFTSNVIVVGIGTVICGMGYMSTTPCMTSYLPYDVPASRRALATTIIFAGVQLGIFLSSYWINFTNTVLAGVMGSDIENSFLACAVLSAVVMVIFIIIDPRSKAQREEQK